MKSQTRMAPAKINLFLKVLGRRPDGYHELNTLMVPITLCDRIDVELSGNDEVKVYCPKQPDLDGRANLAFEAASKWLAASKIRSGVNITITKNIPIQAGLGGGSSDAAAVLLALEDLFLTKLPRDQLHTLATELGADVPFFLSPGPQRATGIGEKLEQLHYFPDFWAVLACAPRGLSTFEVFATLKYQLTLSPVDDSYNRPEWVFEHFATCLVNDLQLVSEAMYPEIGKVHKELLKAGATGASMSGSGPSVFGLFPTREAANQGLQRLSKERGWTYLVVRRLSS